MPGIDTKKIGKLITILKTIFYIIVIIGVIIYFYGLYSTRSEWNYDLAGPVSIDYDLPAMVSLTIPVKIYNPADDVTAKLVYYRIYINGYYAGDGFEPYLILKSGWTEHWINIDIDLLATNCGVVKALTERDKIRIDVVGYAMVDIKTFGKMTVKTLTVPFNVTAKEVQVPRVPDQIRNILTMYRQICSLAKDKAPSGTPSTIPGIPGSGSTTTPTTMTTTTTPQPTTGFPFQTTTFRPPVQTTTTTTQAITNQPTTTTTGLPFQPPIETTTTPTLP